MKSSLISLVLSILVITISNAQNIEKVKGNRNVTLIQTPIAPFHTIEVDEDFEVDIIYSKEPSIEIETDENLHEFINFSVRDSILSFNKAKKITSKKKLRIRVSYNDLFSNIEIRDDAKIHSLTTLELLNANIKTEGNSKASLTIKTDFLNFEGGDKSKTLLNLTSGSTSVNLKGNSKLEALINSPNLNIELYQKADAIIEGDSDNLILKTDDGAKFSGKEFTSKTCHIICESSSGATLEVVDNINVSVSGDSSIYLYNNPKMIINQFSDTSKIQKKMK